jgi:Cys-rich protein (TIGR01571 family)
MLVSAILLYGVPFAAPNVSLPASWHRLSSVRVLVIYCADSQGIVNNDAHRVTPPTFVSLLAVLMAQVMKRMNLTWLGEPGPYISTKNTVKVVVTIVICYIIYSTALEIASMPFTVDTIPSFLPALKAIGSVFFTVYAMYSLCKTRESVRAVYSIPQTRCGGMEDCVCAFFCSCCTVSQLARHTGEYETYPGVCCSETGHPKGSPMVV